MSTPAKYRKKPVDLDAITARCPLCRKNTVDTFVHLGYSHTSHEIAALAAELHDQHATLTAAPAPCPHGCRPDRVHDGCPTHWTPDPDWIRQATPAPAPAGGEEVRG